MLRVVEIRHTRRPTVLLPPLVRNVEMGSLLLRYRPLFPLSIHPQHRRHTRSALFFPPMAVIAIESDEKRVSLLNGRSLSLSMGYIPLLMCTMATRRNYMASDSDCLADTFLLQHLRKCRTCLDTITQMLSIRVASLRRLLSH